MTNYFEPKENIELNLNSRIHFGKYKSKIVKNILYKENVFYFRWIIENIDWIILDKELYDEINKDRVINLSHKFPFGKYEGKTVKYVIDNDTSYIYWFYEYLCDLYNVYFDDSAFEYYEEKLSENKEELEVEKFNKEFSGFY